MTMTTKEKLEEMSRRQAVYKMGYDDGIKDLGTCIAVVILIILMIYIASLFL